MVKIRKKAKRLCNGKLIVTDFRRLDANSFRPLYNFTKKEMVQEIAIYAPDGCMYINNKAYGSDLVSGIFELLMKESMVKLREYRERYSKKFPEIKDFDTWGESAKDAIEEGKTGEVNQSLAMLMIPLEEKRREIEARYYGKNAF